MVYFLLSNYHYIWSCFRAYNFYITLNHKTKLIDRFCTGLVGVLLGKTIILYLVPLFEYLTWKSTKLRFSSILRPKIARKRAKTKLWSYIS